MKIGVVGVGVVGGALVRWLGKHTFHDIACYDPPRQLEDSFDGVQAIFVAVPVPTAANSSQEIGLVREALELFRHHGAPFYIKSSVLPGTCDQLAKEFGCPVYAMPEFLTERRADEDFEAQAVLCGFGSKVSNAWVEQEKFLEKVFPGKAYVLVTNTEAELAKYAHNAMAAIKVNFFNTVYKACAIHKADYQAVLDGVLLSGHIGEQHTVVPGPDQAFGYGGKCLPKDLAAFIGHLKQIKLGIGSLVETETENSANRFGTHDGEQLH